MLVDPDGEQAVTGSVIVGGAVAVEQILEWALVGSVITAIAYDCYSYTSEKQECNIKNAPTQESPLSSNLVEQKSPQIDIATNNSDTRSAGRWRQKQQAEQNRKLQENLQNVDELMPSCSPDPNNDDNNNFSKWLRKAPKGVKIFGGFLVGGQILGELEKFVAPFIVKFKSEPQKEQKVEESDNNKSIIEQQ